MQTLCGCAGANKESNFTLQESWAIPGRCSIELRIDCAVGGMGSVFVFDRPTDKAT